MGQTPGTGPVRTSNQFGIEHLVRNIFVRGGCNNISNIRAIGPNAGIGFFENGGHIIGLERGIVFATGPIAHASGPNTVTDRSGNFNYTGGDPDLNILAGVNVRDRVGFEFDFVPLDSFVTFRYVFASEEYCEFVGSVYNDVFGFFISGPGISGPFADNAQNIALIPGSNSFVSINSVNHQTNAAWFVRNELPADALQCGIPSVNSPHLPFIQYDGFTRPLTATLQLIPCQTYRLRLLVADVGDNFYDSAVFLEAESFNIGGAVQITGFSRANSDAIAYEGCGDAYLEFRRVDTRNLSNPIMVHFVASAAMSTAVEGQDFAPLPRSITIPAGQVSVNLPIVVFNDGLLEPIEQLVIELDIPCSCYRDTAILYLADPPPVLVSASDAAVCNQSPATLLATAQGGRAPFTFQWSSGSTGASVTVLPAQRTQYAVTVTDACGSQATDTATVEITAPPQALLAGAAQVCEGDTARFAVTFTGEPPWQLAWSVNGVVQAPVQGLNASPYFLPATQEGQYQLVQFRDAWCNGIPEGSAELRLMRIRIAEEITPVTCFGEHTGAIRVTLQGDNPPLIHQWAHAPGAGLHLQGLAAGIYTLQVTDSRGCRKSAALAVTSPPPLAAPRFTCDDLRRPAFAFGASGGTPPYRYGIGEQADSDANLFNQLAPGRTYPLLIQDAAGCTLRQDWLAPSRSARLFELPAATRARLGQVLTLQPRLLVPESLIASVEWSPSDGLSCHRCLYPQLPVQADQRYTLRITDVFGCTDEGDIQLNTLFAVDVYVPTAFSPNNDGHNDRLTVYANPYQVVRVLTFSVYDRWGAKLFESTDFPPNRALIGWDGSAHGQPAASGVYVYKLQVELVNGATRTLSGEVLLLR